MEYRPSWSARPQSTGSPSVVTTVTTAGYGAAPSGRRIRPRSTTSLLSPALTAGPTRIGVGSPAGPLAAAADGRGMNQATTQPSRAAVAAIQNTS